MAPPMGHAQAASITGSARPPRGARGDERARCGHCAAAPGGMPRMTPTSCGPRTPLGRRHDGAGEGDRLDATEGPKDEPAVDVPELGAEDEGADDADDAAEGELDHHPRHQAEPSGNGREHDVEPVGAAEPGTGRGAGRSAGDQQAKGERPDAARCADRVRHLRRRLEQLQGRASTPTLTAKPAVAPTVAPTAPPWARPLPKRRSAPARSAVPQQRARRPAASVPRVVRPYALEHERQRKPAWNALQRRSGCHGGATVMNWRQ